MIHALRQLGEMMNSHLIRLYQLLAQLFPDEAASDLLMAEAAIERGRIHAETSPAARWYAIVSEADKDGKVAALLAAALNRYPGNTDLQALQTEMDHVRVARNRFLATST